jgi:hypothetical protein
MVHVIDISPLPVSSVDEKDKKRKSRCSKAADLTSTPYKQELENTPVNRKRTVAARRKINTDAGVMIPAKLAKKSSTGTQDGKSTALKVSRNQKPVNLVNTGISHTSTDRPTLGPCLLSGASLGLTVGKWVLVKYCIGNEEKCFVGELVNQKSDDEHCDDIPKWTVHFLKRSTRNGCTFRDSLSKNQATDDIDDDDIVTTLPDPNVHRGMYRFACDFSAYSVE